MQEPRRIHKLDQETINKIAAGEVLQRPANALKELLENSLDARASTIAISVLDGGLKSLIVTDNGIGIHCKDLDIVCERFTTSKLSKFSDLSRIQTFGFRGEALASMTYVGHVCIRTKTADQDVAWIANYENGKMLESPKPIAGNQGTMITIQDMFYNVPARKKALKNLNEEYARILEVCQRYSIHNSSVSFMCKKHGTSSWDICTPSNSSILSNIGLIYGKSLVKELLPVSAEDSGLEFKAQGFISNANYSEKKFTFILFINERLVVHSSLKKSIEGLYSAFLPKNAHPFVYLSLVLKSENVDVNVHPTKQQVNFLYEDFIIDKIRDHFSSCLAENNSSRSFLTQSLIPQYNMTEVKGSKKLETPTKQPEHKLVRTDSATRTLDSFLVPKSGISNHVVKIVDFNANDSNSFTEGNQITKDLTENLTKRREIVGVQLISILELRSSIENNENAIVTELFREHTFIGLVDDFRALIQHQTRLLMVDFKRISNVFFYQVIIYGFANFSRINFEQPLNISQLLSAFFSVSKSLKQQDEIDEIISLLIDKREMLVEYFSLDISAQGELLSLPVLLKGYIPNMSKLPQFLIEMACEVNWTSEKQCFKSLAVSVSKLYEYDWNSRQSFDDYTWSVEHLLFPALKSHLIGIKEMADDGTIIELTQLPELYKIFERC